MTATYRGSHVGTSVTDPSTAVSEPVSSRVVSGMSGEGVRPAVVGVLAVQGDVREHVAVLRRLGVDVVLVRRAGELARVDALVLPGGESTAIDRLVRVFGLQGPLRERIRAGMPVLGSCAGMILLADRLTERAADQQTLGGIDMTVRRNGFGRQVDSFETDLEVVGLPGPPLHAVFIRAPQVVEVGPDVEVLARVGVPGAGDTIVAVRQGVLLATAFHPEVSGDDRFHRVLVGLAGQARTAAAPRTTKET